MPPRCVLCETELSETTARQICSGCVADLLVDAGPACRRCGMSHAPDNAEDCPSCRGRRFHFDRVFRCGEYNGALRDAVLRAKNLAGEPIAAALGDLLANAVGRAIANETGGATTQAPIDLVTCVPSFWLRRSRRGTNSAAVMAQVVARGLRIPAALDLLICRRNIEKQSSLSLAERKKNVRHAFRKSWGYQIDGANILLIDDVLTSGATAHEIAGVLRQGGAARVWVAIIARSLGPDW